MLDGCPCERRLPVVRPEPEVRQPERDARQGRGAHVAAAHARECGAGRWLSGPRSAAPSCSAAGSPAGTSPACSASVGRRSSRPRTSCSTRRMLPEAASGTLEPRHVVVPLRMMCPHAELLLGRATSLDRERKSVHVETEDGATVVRYERLVVALGAVSRTLPIPGLADHALGFKALADAIHLRNHVLRRLEAAASASTEDDRRRELTFVFVGAGYAGRRGARGARRPRARRAPLLPRARATTTALGARRRGAEDPPRDPDRPRRLRSAPARRPRRRHSRRHDARVASSRTQPFSPTATASSRAPSSGRRECARTRPTSCWGCRSTSADASSSMRRCESRNEEHVWALGDGARVPNAATPERFDPPTCQHALRQARRLAKNLVAPTPEPYRYRMLGQVATLGRYKGIADVLGLRLRGFPGWFVTRTYHLYQLPPRDAKAPGRRRLDDRALLPPGHRRAQHARPPRAA